MITRKPNKFLITLIAASLFFCLPVFSDILTDQTLQSDLSYYRKTAARQGLNANDRLYILKRIEEKYDGSGLDTSALRRELDKAGSGEFEAPRMPAPVKPRARMRSAAAGKVEKIFVSETRAESKIIIAATGVTRSNYFLMKAPSPDEPPKIILDLYGVENRLSSAARDINTREGLFSNVTAVQFDGPPNNIVRVVAALRRDTAYTVKKQGEVWVISAVKPVQENLQAESPADDAAPIMVPAPRQDAQAAETYDGNDDYITAVTVNSPADRQPAGSTKQGQPPQSPAPEALAKGTADNYLVENGDILGIIIYPADELSREVIVQPDGNIQFPLIGSVQAKGLTLRQLENTLSQRLSRFIASPQVTITVKQFSRRQIFITGEVRGVGAYNFKDNLRLLEFISSIGGFTEQANRREVKIYRGPPTKRQIHVVNVEDLVKSGDFSKDFLLEQGDIIEVQRGQTRVAILGDIRNPGYYDYKDNLKLVELVSIAGGFTDTAKITEVSVIHGGEGEKQAVTKVNLKSILSGKSADIILRIGDTVYLPKGRIASANWFVSNILPWISLISLVIIIRAGL